MSLQELEAKFASLKDKAEGDFKDLVLHLEAVFQHIQISHAESLVKNAVYDSLHAASVKIENIANNTVIPAAKEVEAVAETVVKTARKATSSKTTTS